MVSHKMNTAFAELSHETLMAPSEGLLNPRKQKLASIMGKPHVDLIALREILWSGCPSGEPRIRAMAWKLVLGYLPCRSDRQVEFCLRKRSEYPTLVREYTKSSTSLDSESDSLTGLLKQIQMDIPRTYIDPNYGFILVDSRIKKLLERVLLVWAQRNPACGYVQGMNDACVPLLVALLLASDSEEDEISLERMSDEQLSDVEADLYWMFSRLLQDLQDNYTFGQPGIQRFTQKIELILRRSDPGLMEHLDNEQVSMLQLVFRWFNCLLTRELNMKVLFRCYDTLLAEENGFSEFLVYVCLALMKRLSPELLKSNFQEIMTLISTSSITQSFTVNEVEAVLAEAYVLKSIFHESKLDV
jgi:hypothetical protein